MAAEDVCFVVVGDHGAEGSGGGGFEGFWEGGEGLGVEWGRGGFSQIFFTHSFSLLYLRSENVDLMRNPPLKSSSKQHLPFPHKTAYYHCPACPLPESLQYQPPRSCSE